MVLRRIKRLFSRKKVINANIITLSPSEKLRGKHILITGGAGGIGQAMAGRFIKEGAKVIIAGRDENKLKLISEKIGCQYLKFDITEFDTFDSFLKQAISMMGEIDCLVNNAGVSLHESFDTVTAESFDIQVNTNLKGPFFLTQNFIAYVLKNNLRANILFISSETGETADIRPYGITKAAINSLMQGLAFLYNKSSIRINSIAPGITATKMIGFYDGNDLSFNKNPLGRLYLPDEIAEVATFLLSDVSGCISGQILTCNNGKTINARWK